MLKREDHKVRIETRHRLWKEAKGICSYCQRNIPIEKASLDHIIPVNHTEENYGPENLIFCCKPCNYHKRDLIIFSNLYDRIIYPIIDIPFFFQYNYIVRNFKDKKNKKTAFN